MWIWNWWRRIFHRSSIVAVAGIHFHFVLNLQFMTDSSFIMTINRCSYFNGYIHYYFIFISVNIRNLWLLSVALVVIYLSLCYLCLSSQGYITQSIYSGCCEIYFLSWFYTLHNDICGENIEFSVFIWNRLKWLFTTQ